MALVLWSGVAAAGEPVAQSEEPAIALSHLVEIRPDQAGGVSVSCLAEDCVRVDPQRFRLERRLGPPTEPAAKRLAIRTAYALREAVGPGGAEDAEYRAMSYHDDAESVGVTTRLAGSVGGVPVDGTVSITTDHAGQHVTGVDGRFPKITEAMRAKATLTAADAIAAAIAELRLSDEAVERYRLRSDGREPFEAFLSTTEDGPARAARPT